MDLELSGLPTGATGGKEQEFFLLQQSHIGMLICTSLMFVYCNILCLG